MHKSKRAWEVLVGHFFRRFFDNDTVQMDGETSITVVRAACIVAVPGLMVAFFLQNQYPRRSAWGAMEDQYFFVLFSFVVMGAVSVFEWSMLFPDRLDFQVLSPLPLTAWQMLMAKGTALMMFLLIFLVSCNVFGTLVLPAVTKGAFYRQLCAHAMATTLAGVFAALSVLALGSVLLCVLDARRFRALSPLVQGLAVLVLVLLLVHYLKTGDAFEQLLGMPAGARLGWARWLPPVWFLGVYEVLLHGAAAAPFAHAVAPYAVRAIVVVAVLVALTYPLAWARMRRLTLEGTGRAGGEPLRSLSTLLKRAVACPAERAIFYFIGQTISRQEHYQTYLAFYCGTGLAIAVGCAVGVDKGQLVLSTQGLHALVPLLLFWVIAGLQGAFAFPLDLRARWVFRLASIPVRDCTSAARRWALLCAAMVSGGALAVLCLAHWNHRQLLVQAVLGVGLCLLLSDGFFFTEQRVPFSRPRLPGRTSLPLTLTLYVGLLPLYLQGAIALATGTERHPLRLLWLGCFAAGAHFAVRAADRRFEAFDEEIEGYDGEFQILGL